MLHVLVFVSWCQCWNLGGEVRKKSKGDESQGVPPLLYKSLVVRWWLNIVYPAFSCLNFAVYTGIQDVFFMHPWYRIVRSEMIYEWDMSFWFSHWRKGILPECLHKVSLLLQVALLLLDALNLVVEVPHQSLLDVCWVVRSLTLGTSVIVVCLSVCLCVCLLPI